ncbi:aminoglycoside phosphotransferase family protein [Arthrobacter sp. CAN_C5]|uniref:aminoglycoside phosphotransferase family protein n=1 Tax=Arthrobacter sp. CAN_C5 TaxID=2760706 RepID=UPI001AEA6077|nr:aminoglycoside phosphotransferase family protein [Arthrobacter sp. CAN_C5]MBP2217680.1 aminoglycoside phosphotransferase (APT) family kinase protein [Arthrobacter sp. CAN_C5]
MANRPAAEVLITADLVRELLGEQHPDLAELPLNAVAEGWDNVIFRLGSDLSVRLPRREAAAQLARNEQAWLPRLLSDQPGADPGAQPPESPLRFASTPVRVGEPSSSYPWHWSITTWVEGAVGTQIPLGDRTPAAEDLADFVLAFQQPAPEDAPRNPVRGGALGDRDSALQQRLAALELPTADLLDLWRELRDSPAWDGTALWLHGDLHAANLVLGPDKKLAAVLDFGDLGSGDPATDLAAAWLVFDRYGRRVFQNRINAARPTSDATWQRARGWALCIGAAMAAHSDDDAAFQTMGQQVLHSVLVDHGTRLAGGAR